jgi:hypothetical protein
MACPEPDGGRTWENKPNLYGVGAILFGVQVFNEVSGSWKSSHNETVKLPLYRRTMGGIVIISTNPRNGNRQPKEVPLVSLGPHGYHPSLIHQTAKEPHVASFK